MKNEAGYRRAVGSTRYLDIRRPDRGIEIGWTWLDTAFQRTALNTESKLLLLTHAFEGLGAVRVQLKQEERPSHGQGDGTWADKARAGQSSRLTSKNALNSVPV